MIRPRFCLTQAEMPGENAPKRNGVSAPASLPPGELS
jgi:hypothetical protein